MFIRRTEANWWVLHFSTLVQPDNISSLEKLRNDGLGSTDTNDDVLNDEANKDMDNDAVNGPSVLAHVELARTVCTYIASFPKL